MPFCKNYKCKYSKVKRSRRGKYSRRMNFKARVKKVLMKNSDTKYIDGGENQVVLWHIVWASATLPMIPLTPSSVPNIISIYGQLLFSPEQGEINVLVIRLIILVCLLLCILIIWQTGQIGSIILLLLVYLRSMEELWQHLFWSISEYWHW